MGITTLGRERDTNPFLRELAHHPAARAAMSAIQAPRGTFDVLPADAARRAVLEEHARRILGAPATAGSRRPTFEATELFARGVGEATDIVQKEMYTFDDGGGRSLTLRPEGTAPVCRAYLEHGMHKQPQPVKLWYLSSFFRAEAPQAGPLPPVLAGRRRGDRLRRARGRRRADPAAGRSARGGRRRATSAAAVEPRHARDARARTARSCTAYLRAHEDELSEEVASRIDLNPMRAFDADRPPAPRR